MRLVIFDEVGEQLTDNQISWVLFRADNHKDDVSFELQTTKLLSFSIVRLLILMGHFDVVEEMHFLSRMV